MRTFILCSVILALGLAASAGFAQEDPHKELFTGKFLNGRFLSGLSDDASTVFVQGMIDGVGKMSPGTLSGIYPGRSREDVVMAVKNYYVSNPDKIDRPVADVLMTGAK